MKRLLEPCDNGDGLRLTNLGLILFLAVDALAVALALLALKS